MEDIDSAGEEAQLAALERAIARTNGFALFFCVCGHAGQRARLLDRLAAHLEPRSILTVALYAQDSNLLHILESHLKQGGHLAGQVLAVWGLEDWLAPTDAERSPVVLNLNSTRNYFASRVPCTIMIWLPEAHLGAIARGAPDFFSVRSGTFYFPAPLENKPTMGHLWADLSSDAGSTHRDKLDAIEKLCHISLKAREAERWQDLLDSLERLSGLYQLLGFYSDAIDVLRYIIGLIGGPPDVLIPYRIREAGVNVQIGAFARAEHLIHATDTESMTRFASTDSSALAAYVWLWTIKLRWYRATGNPGMASLTYEKLLGEAIVVQDEAVRACWLTDWAAVAVDMGEPDRALDLVNRSVPMQPMWHPNRAVSLNLIALIYAGRGQLLEADKLWHEALQLVERAVGFLHPDVATIHENRAQAGLKPLVEIRDQIATRPAPGSPWWRDDRELSHVGP